MQSLERPYPFHRLGVCALATVVLLGSWAASQPLMKSAAPDKETQVRTEALIKKLFYADYEAAQRGAEGARHLASTLLHEAKATKDDPVLRFGALNQARDLAAEAGDARLILQAIDELTKYYDVKPLPMKRAALAQAARKATTKEANEAIVEAALASLDEALSEDDYDAAKELLEAAETAGVQVRNLALYGKIDKRSREVEAARKEFAAVKIYSDRLAKDANDAEANLHMGKYVCLIKGNWERGLPLLAKSSHPLWRGLAERELTGPKETKQQVDLGDEHQRLAESEQGQAKRNLQRRALYWYEQALPKLDGLTKIRIAREVKDLSQLFPSLLARAEITGELLKIENAHIGGVQVVAVSADGKLILSGGFQDKLVKLWDGQSGKELKQLTGHTGNIQALAFSPDGKYGASGCTNNQLRLWDLDKKEMLRQLPGHTDYLRGLAFLPDNKTLLSASDDKTLRLWDIAAGKELKQLTGHTNYINSLSLDKEGKRAATGSVDLSARVWDLVKGAEIRRVQHERDIWAVALSPDGKLLVTSGQDRTVRVWEVDSGKELRRLPHPSMVWTVAISPDGKHVLTGSGDPPTGKPGDFKDPFPTSTKADNFVRVWELETGKETRKLEGHTQLIRMVDYSADGRYVVSCSNDNTIRVWGQK